MSAAIDQHTGQPDSGRERDNALELEIDAEYNQMIDRSKTDEESRAHFHAMCLLINRRSPAQVHRMELDRRLAHKQLREISI
jgi:hypothetical protein